MNTIKLALIGSISGFLSYFLTVSFFGSFGIFLSAGLVFGLLIGLYFFIINILKPINLFFWIIVSVSSYFMAVMLIIRAPWGLLPDFAAIPLLASGTIGAFIMLLGFSSFVYSLNLKNILLLSLLGGILSLGWFLIPYIFGTARGWGPTEENLLGLYITWQTGMAAAIGFIMDRRS